VKKKLVPTVVVRHTWTGFLLFMAYGALAWTVGYAVASHDEADAVARGQASSVNYALERAQVRWDSLLKAAEARPVWVDEPYRVVFYQVGVCNDD